MFEPVKEVDMDSLVGSLCSRIFESLTWQSDFDMDNILSSGLFELSGQIVQKVSALPVPLPLRRGGILYQKYTSRDFYSGKMGSYKYLADSSSPGRF